MTDLLNVSDEFEARLAALVEPLAGELELINRELAATEALVVGLKDKRRRVAKVLTELDPTNYPSAKTTKTSTNTKVRTETLDRIRDWLVAHRSELDAANGFSAPSLISDHGFKVVARATLQHALNELHSRGAVRLDRRGKGGAKIYVLV